MELFGRLHFLPALQNTHLISALVMVCCFLQHFRRSIIGSRPRVYLFHCSERLHFIPTPKVICKLGVTLTLRDRFEASRDNVESNGPLKSQPNVNRTEIEVFFRSDSITPTGGTDWNTSRPHITWKSP